MGLELTLFAGLLLALALFGILGGAVLLLTSTEGRISTRMREFVASDEPAPVSHVAEARRRKRADLFAQIDARLARRASAQALSMRLERANLNLTVSEFTLLRVAAAVFVALVLVALASGLWWVVLLPGVALGAWLPLLYLRLTINRRMSRLDRQLPDILNILAGSVRTGSSLFQALDRIAREADEPSRTEYLRVVRAVTLGAPLEQALKNLAERIPTEDMDMLVTAITIQQQTGGNLAHTLDLIATTVRERHRIQREIQVLSAQQRFSAYLLAGLPILLVGVLFIISPNYIGKIFEPGCMLILPCTVVVLLITGFIVMNKIAAIDV
jgi:tight adherence protein B